MFFRGANRDWRCLGCSSSFRGKQVNTHFFGLVKDPPTPTPPPTTYQKPAALNFNGLAVFPCGLWKDIWLPETPPHHTDAWCGPETISYNFLQSWSVDEICMCIDNWLLIGPSVPAVEVLPGALIIANPREKGLWRHCQEIRALGEKCGAEADGHWAEILRLRKYSLGKNKSKME